MANGFMNPFGTQASIPFLFGEDQASQEALMAQQEAGKNLIKTTGDVGLNTMGLVGDIPASILNPFLKEESRYKTQFTPNAPNIPALGSENLKNILSTTGDFAKSSADKIGLETDPSKIIKNLLPTSTPMTNDLELNSATSSSLPSSIINKTVGKSPLEIHTEYLKNLEEQGVSADERTQIAAQMIAPFLRDPAIQAESDAAFKAASAQRMKDVRDEAAARQATVEAARGGESSEMSIADYRQLARQAGMKGSAVNAMAKQMQQEAETKAKKAETDIAATEALVASRGAPKATAYDKAEQIIDRLIAEGRIKPDQKDTLLLRALRLERNTGGDFGAIEKLLEVDSETVSNSNQNDLVTISAIDGQPV